MRKKGPKIFIHLVSWNSMKFLPDCLNSIFNQTYNNFSVLIIDNASTDGIVEYLSNNYPEIKVFRNNKNIGFTAAHNQALKIVSLDKDNLENSYVLIINADVILEKDYLNNVIKVMESDKEIGAITGKILKVYTLDPEINEKNKTQNIDSAGLKLYRSKKIIDRGENEIDRGQYNNEGQVFGVSGACALYRLAALEDIKYQNEYFDQDFFAYKDDADASYRLRWRGWKIYYYPEAVCYHHRQVFGSRLSIWQLLKHRRQRSSMVKFYSYRNHLYLLIKNLSFIDFLKDFPFIFFYELRKFIYIFFFERKTLGSLNEVFKKMPLMLRKRRFIMKNKKVQSGDLRRWLK
jgi:GT2 family glycosyltransferase